MRFIILDESPSTNTHLAAIVHECDHGTVVVAKKQTAGRGQRGNSWESAPGENITMSILLRPESIHPAHQFAISRAVSLGIVEVLRRYIPGHDVRIKWPNDIYVDDSKICGILIENSITAMSIRHSIIGIGINVNQRHFVSDAPNPVSMWQLTGREFNLAELTEEFCETILREVDRAIACEESGSDSEELQRRYFAALWRNSGFHPYRDNLRGENIMAAIESVAPDGILTLRLPTGEKRSYAFKEISSVVKESLL
ncbi:MAG: biotin--[acetyl-CoA-carboxylase] ligase [Bacteroides sp.]|nr:biotin--[acetyl-CoA-carboxylase] ligase [Bacteroides sp.]